MLLTVAALVLGVGLGLIRGGRLSDIRLAVVRWLPLLAAGFVIQSVALLVDIPARTSVLVLGSFLLVVGLAKNLHLLGAGVLVVGLLANLTALVANGHVPTRLDALLSAGLVDASIDPNTIAINGGLGALETDATRLAFLGDIIPIGFMNEVASFGDLITLAGLIVFSMRLIKRPRPKGLTIDDLLGPAAATPIILGDLDTAGDVDLREGVVDLTTPNDGAADDVELDEANEGVRILGRSEGGETTQDWAGWSP